MVKLHQGLQRIEEHLSLVTRMLHVAAELIESFDANVECDQGTVETDAGLMHTYFSSKRTPGQAPTSQSHTSSSGIRRQAPLSGPVVVSIRKAAF